MVEIAVRAETRQQGGRGSGRWEAGVVGTPFAHSLRSRWYSELSEVLPDAGHVWSSGWRICFTLGCKTDSSGWQYGASADSGKWTSEAGKESTVRRRRWRRKMLGLDLSLGLRGESDPVRLSDAARIAAARSGATEHVVRLPGANLLLHCSLAGGDAAPMILDLKQSIQQVRQLARCSICGVAAQCRSLPYVTHPV